jgi:hypothetical protein
VPEVAPLGEAEVGRTLHKPFSVTVTESMDPPLTEYVAVGILEQM